MTRIRPKIGAAAGPILAAATLLLGACASGAASPPPQTSPPAATADAGTPIRTVDDSYTISQRFGANRPAHPELALPVIETGAGRRILFDRLYAQRGTRELHADVFLPAPAAAPSQAIVMVHGGAWRSGNASNFYAMADLLARRGYAVILPEFRLAPEQRYPAGLRDVNAAIDWVRSNADAFGIDPRRIAIGGESSGGQMAALIAYTAGTALYSDHGNPTPRLNALIDIDGVLDFTDPVALRHENAAGEKSVAALWLGGSMETAPARWKEASPATHLGPNSPPTLILSGEADRFTGGRETVIAALNARGIPARHIHFPGLPHTFWLFEPYVGQVVEAIDQFLRQEVGHPSKPTEE